MASSRLRSYRAKRDFSETPEPGPAAPRRPAARKPAKRPRRARQRDSRFVIQEHSATRLHWDLRLERDGVLASWAVPNGIPDDPGTNRKAIRTEDHPLGYLDFEGEIPAGHYGAGSMRVWDRGTYECEKWEPDKVVLTFHGERVRGRYALFRAGRVQKDWMIHRMDPPADPGREPMPEQLRPMLARPGPLPEQDGVWAFEIKWDGVRALVFSEPGRVRIRSRTGRDISAQYPEVRRINRALGATTAVLDGEIVALDADGRPSFARLQERMNLASESTIRRRAREVPAALVVFDVLYLEGRSLIALPYSERRRRLDALVLDGPAWKTPESHTGDGKALLEASAAQGLEGVVAKRVESVYEPGRRSAAWIKVKNSRRQEFVIGGWLPGEGRRRERIGALLVGYYEDGELRFAGRVGTGFTDATLADLGHRLASLRRETSPFKGRGVPRRAVFCEPQLVAEVEFTEWTPGGLLRHPSYKALRSDKEPAEVVREDRLAVAPEPAPAARGSSRAAPARRKQTTRARKRTRSAPAELDVFAGAEQLPGGAVEVQVQGRRIKISNRDKVLYPATGFTKGDLINYYARVAPALLAHLHDRPLTLKRYPDGVEGKYFYEKQCPKHRPEWVATAPVYSGRNSAEINFCLAQDVATLVWLGNLADIELHTSLSRADALQRPTTLVFDLDPGAPAGILQCCEVGLVLHGLFEGLGRRSFAKTSGSKGLQVYVPLNVEDVTYTETKPFARQVAELLEAQMPDLVVSRMTKSVRRGRVLVDWSQNAQHKTTVCAYSVRARERPTVSTPVTWEEVERARTAADGELLTFDTDAVLERVARDGDLFADVVQLRQDLPAI